MKAVGAPSLIKRPWLSIVKMLTKTRYRLEVKNVHLYDNEEHIRTQWFRRTIIIKI